MPGIIKIAQQHCHVYLESALWIDTQCMYWGCVMHYALRVHSSLD